MKRIIDFLRQWLHRRRMQRLAHLPAYIGVDLTRCNDQTAGLLPKPSEADAIQYPASNFYDKLGGLDFSIDMAAINEALTRMVESFRASVAEMCDKLRESGIFAQMNEELTLIQYGQPAEIHRMRYARKARTRKKYRNRIKRRARRAMKKEART